MRNSMTTRPIAFLLVTVSVLLPARLIAADAAAEPPIVLQAGRLSVGLSPDEGRPVSLAVGGHSLLSAPGELTLQVDKSPAVSLGKNLTGFSTIRRDGSIIVEGREPQSGVDVRAEWRGGQDIECRLTLTGRQSPRQEAAVELRLPWTKRPLEVLAPSGDDRHQADFSRSLAFGYRATGRGLAMPAVVLYQPEDDWGLTVLADFTLPIRGFELKLEDRQPAVAARRVHLRLEPGKPVNVSLILHGHEGDWRPGLGYVVRRFPDFFVVADPRVPNLHGSFVCSGLTPPDKTIAEWKRQHVKTVEVHGTIPFYGQHLPLGDRWTVFADDQWHTLRKAADPQKPADDAPWEVVHRYVTAKRPPNMSVAQVNDYIRRLHAQGIYAVMYFNPTESWKLWIKEKYPQDLVLNAAGQPTPVWYESYLVCPNPESPWGKHLLDEFATMMDLHPEADGFFMDQSCYDHLDFAHDDGWSIQNGRTGYRLGWAIGQLSRQCRTMAKARGKFLWWNGPYNVDIAHFAEGMMAEAGNESQVRCIHYLTMGGRACCTLSQKGEITFQNCAAYGLYPTAMSGPLAQLAQRYWPVVELFRGKRWEFAPRAIDLPPGTKGNLWRLPDGNVLASVVTAGRSVDGQEFDLNVPVTMRLPDAAEFRAAYFLSPDLLGKRRLTLQREGHVLRVTVPRHRSTSAILLAKTGVHLALDGTPSAVVGVTARAAAVVDNWSDRPVSGRWLAGDAGGDESIQVAPGATARCSVALRSPSHCDGRRQAIQCRAELAGATYGGQFEFYVDESLVVGLPSPAMIEQGQTKLVCVQVFNAVEERNVQVRLSGKGLRVEPAEQTVTVASKAKREVEFRVEPLRAGRFVLEAYASAGQNISKAACHLEALATKLSPTAFGEIRAGKLTFDLFGSDGGKYGDKPLWLNGIRIGLLPTHGDNWGPAEMIVPPEALKTSRQDNELRIENRGGDAFKIARFRLRLTLADGVQALSELNPGVFSSMSGWDFAEGAIFEKGQLRTQLRIPVGTDAPVAP